MSTSLSHNNLSYDGSLWIENRNIHKDPGTTSFKMMSSEYVMTCYGKFLQNHTCLPVFRQAGRVFGQAFWINHATK